MQELRSSRSDEAGFSLVELLISITIILAVMAIASELIAGSFNVRARENQRSEALADVQRALNIMSREIANSGFGLTDNGIVAAESDTNSIRFRANLNAYSGQTTSNSVTDDDEDVIYKLANDGTNSYIVRLDVNTNNQTTVLANRIDNFRIRYFASKVDYTIGDCDIVLPTGVSEVTSKSNAKYLVLSICVTLPARGYQGQAGYQPEGVVQIVSDVALRNNDLVRY